ncbi:hypothetical protein ACJMK2_026938 [Sinanodonta woodiana]|uniref:Peptidase S1 domain-containing protein n=1 Tax=Sinanodonta woodiana TaxID=1069815 RepID=A0ABD3XL63_SINWO
MYSIECKLKPLKEDDHLRLKHCIVRHSSRLLKEHSNIQIISPCSVRSKRFGTNYWQIKYETCIVLYVHYKGIIPFGESLFPTELDGISVDVREGEFKLLSNPYLRMGSKIGAVGANKYGTLGGFVDLENETIGALTCAHVVLNNDEFSNYAEPNGDSGYTGADHRLVCQPDSSNRDHVFGTIEKIVWESGNEHSAGVDAALVKITATERSPTCGEFDCIDNIHGRGNNGLMFCSGKIITNLSPDIYAKEIFKCGYKTGMTNGRLHSDYFIFRNNINGHIFHRTYNQIEIKNCISQQFSERGDSGALVMVDNEDNINDLSAIGLLVGSTSYHTTIASPIGDVLEKLNIPSRKLKTFPVEEQDRSTHIGRNHTSNIPSRTTDHPCSLLRPILDAIQGDVLEIKREFSEFKREIRFMREDIGIIHYYLEGSRRYLRR